MNNQQILEQMLSFCLQQHQIKDKLIEDLTKKNTELEKQLNGGTQNKETKNASK